MMFFASKKRKLQKEYEKALKNAMEAQRAGRIQEYAELNSRAEELLKKIQELKPSRG